MRVSGSIVVFSGMLLLNLTIASHVFAQSGFEWVNGVGSTSQDYGFHTTLDAAGNVYTTGFFWDTVDFDPGPATTNLTATGSSWPDVFVTKHGADGSLVWAKSVGGSFAENVRGLSVDASGMVYLLGDYNSSLRYNGTGAIILTNTGYQDTFILKINGLGDLQWARRINGAGYEVGEGIESDASGNVFVTGYFGQYSGFGGSATFGSTTLTATGTSYDIYITKLDAAGTFLWAKQIGASGQDYPQGLAVDGSNNILITGGFGNTIDFNPGTGTGEVFEMTSTGSGDVFITKLDNNGNFVWARQLGGVNNEFSVDIAIDGTNNVYTTGGFQAGAGEPADFDPGSGVANLFPFTGGTGNDVFISKLDLNGAFVWIKQLGGTGDDQPVDLALDASSNVYTIGTFSGTADFDPGGDVQIKDEANGSFFISKVSASGNFLLVMQESSIIRGITADINTIITTGGFTGTYDFAPGSCEFNLSSTGGNDIYSRKISQTAIPAPTITSIAPLTGSEGTAFAINGTNFSTNPINNIVRFNELTAPVNSSTAAIINTEVPVGAQDAQIAVTVGCQTVVSSITFDVTGTCNIPIHERDALTAIYNNTNGPAWSNNTNWLSVDASTWHGVTVTGCRVTELDLSVNHLDGNMTSPAIKDLKFLEILKVDGNPELTGFLPLNIGTMTSLRELNGQYSNFTGIPNSIVNCTSLEVIDLTGNVNLGAIPSFLGSVTSLKTINLASTNGSGSIPETIGNLTSLEVLNLADNNYSEATPDELGNLLSLQALWLNNNSLTGSFPAGINSLLNLQQLDLSSNNFSGPITQDLSALTQLSQFNISHNSFNGTFPSSFASLTSLNSVDISDNHFTSIPTISSYDLHVGNNFLDFGDLEPNDLSTVNFSYTPQGKLPPGGTISFVPGGTLNIPFSTPGSANSYQWYRGATLIPGATSATLNITGMTVADVGLYYVEVYNYLLGALTLISESYIVTTNSCGTITPTTGELDLTFIPDFTTPVTAIGRQSTGKIIATNYTESGGGGSGTYDYFESVRLNTDGSMDNTFTNFSHDWGHAYSGLLIQPNDTILSYYPYSYSEGEQLFQTGPEGGDDFFKLFPDVIHNYVYLIAAIGQQPDGKLIIAGNWGSDDRTLTRFEKYDDGAGFVGYRADDSFSPAPELEGELISVIKVQPDDHVLIGGNPSMGGIIRLKPNGDTDASFSAYTDDWVYEIALQPDGKIIIGGNFTYVNDIPIRGIARLNSDGSLDNSFIGIGITTMPMDEYYISEVAVQSNGKIIIGGYFTSINGVSRTNLARLNPDGTIDCAFDPGTGPNQEIMDLLLQPDNKIVIAGAFTEYNGTARIGIARINNSAATMSVDFNPENKTVCDGDLASFTTVASGTTNIQYHWQFSSDGVLPYLDISDGGGYSNTTDLTLQVTTTSGFGEGFYRCRITGDLATAVYSSPAQLAVTSVPTLTANNISICQGEPITITASGGTDGNYRWEDSDGNLIAGAVNSVFTSDGTDFGPPYEVYLVDGSCIGNRVTVNVSINQLPTVPAIPSASTCVGNTVTLTASGGTNGQYRWYAAATGSTLATPTTNDTYITPALSTTTSYFVAINDGTCESARTMVTVTVTGACNAPPAFTSATVSAPINGSTTIELLPLLSDPNDDIDFSTLSITEQPLSGALATLNGTLLFVDYTGINFSGTDALTLSVCDFNAACVSQSISITVTGEIEVYNAVSPNGDGKNDFFKISLIGVLEPENTVTIYNRWGSKVFETENYSDENSFRGLNQNGNELPSGTYFYEIIFKSSGKKESGYLTLKR